MALCAVNAVPKEWLDEVLASATEIQKFPVMEILMQPRMVVPHWKARLFPELWHPLLTKVPRGSEKYFYFPRPPKRDPLDFSLPPKMEPIGD